MRLVSPLEVVLPVPNSRGTLHLLSMRDLGPVAIVGHQEPPLEEGVLSGSHSHLSHHQVHTPVSTHLITDHRNLSPVIKSTISTHSSRTVTVWSQTFHVDSPDPLTFCLQSHRSCAPPSPSSIAVCFQIIRWCMNRKEHGKL